MKNMEKNSKKKSQTHTNSSTTRKSSPACAVCNSQASQLSWLLTESNNCAYLPIDHEASFSETMFLLLGGTGVGFSVQRHHVEKLPKIHKPTEETQRYVIGDSIEGWADAVKVLIKSYFHSGPRIRFDYTDIRPKGARLVTSGGKAPGPDGLEILFSQDGTYIKKQKR